MCHQAVPQKYLAKPSNNKNYVQKMLQQRHKRSKNLKFHPQLQKLQHQLLKIRPF